MSFNLRTTDALPGYSFLRSRSTSSVRFVSWVRFCCGSAIDVCFFWFGAAVLCGGVVAFVAVCSLLAPDLPKLTLWVVFPACSLFTTQLILLRRDSLGCFVVARVVRCGGLWWWLFDLGCCWFWFGVWSSAMVFSCRFCSFSSAVLLLSASFCVSEPTVCLFSLFCWFRVWVDLDFWPRSSGYVSKTRKGMVLLTKIRKGLVRLTRRGLGR